MNNKFLLQDLVQSILETNDLDKKEVETFVRAYFAVIERALFEEEYIKINDLGKFSLQKVEARKSVNVTTGEAFEIKAHYKLAFVPDVKLREIANKPFEHLEAVELDAEPELTQDEAINPNKPITKEDNIMEKKEKTVFVVTDKPAANEKKTPPAPPKPKKGKLVAWIVFVVIMCALIIFALYKTLSPDTKVQLPVDDVVTEIEPTTPAVEETSAPAPKVVDPSSWETLKVVRLERGKRLTLLAQEYYGNKVFWVYIYEANKDQIKNPNKILAGTKIRIPKADPAVINAKDPESVRIAQEKETKYRAQFSK
ncbi:MAG: HU family DNA-binding protein [Bacteroidales bacterium]|jgi:nucleoid DNA-binding protein|nr:HU family DNA-binding protein [Bacteroidales bacterium]MDD3431271.1 HU family DNA-binding protein [Bacteroidales bacterium]MDD4360874.1 HU family DNA-binding protein [Bacteroidales bacterium]MDD4430603.1 HU family DNA-binding protein [Bacteroidales bacterium]